MHYRIKDLCTDNYHIYIPTNSQRVRLNFRLLRKETETERLEILKQILPDTYKYLVSEFPIKERSQTVGETKFNVTLRVHITNKEDKQVFLQNFDKKSGTTHNTFCGNT